eukprot:scaffold236_cov419-Prasinococcus_capsulatus_cf.AAC.38
MRVQCNCHRSSSVPRGRDQQHLTQGRAHQATLGRSQRAVHPASAKECQYLPLSSNGLFVGSGVLLCQHLVADSIWPTSGVPSKLFRRTGPMYCIEACTGYAPQRRDRLALRGPILPVLPAKPARHHAHY